MWKIYLQKNLVKISRLIWLRVDYHILFSSDAANLCLLAKVSGCLWAFGCFWGSYSENKPQMCKICIQDMGEPLKNYASSPWRKRAELSFHLIRFDKNSEKSLHSWHEWLQAGNAFDRERAGTFLLSHRLGSRKLCRHNWHHESEFKILSSSKKTSQSLNLARQVSLVDLEHLIVVNTSRLWAERADPHISDNWGSR